MAPARWWLVATAGLAAACGAHPKAGTIPLPIAAPLVEQARVRWPETTEADLAEGRELFVTRCNRCHDLPDRRAYDEQRWPRILDTMGPRAKLDRRQHQLVLRFILVERGS
jgi:cytochrome c5